jgi:hypothetical protein
MNSGILTTLCISFLVFAFVSKPVQGQSSSLIHDGTKTIALEWVSAAFPDSENPSVTEYSYGTLSSNFYLSGRFLAQPGLVIVGEIPFATYSRTYKSTFMPEAEEISGNGIGNPYIGVEAGNAERTLYVEAGLRIPAVDYNRGTARDDNNNEFAFESAYETDFERIGAFMDDFLPVTVLLNWHPEMKESKFRFKIRGGLSTLYGHRDRMATNLSFLVYGLYLSYTVPEVIFQASWGGRYLTGTRGATRTQVAWEHFVFSVSVPVKPINIGLAFRLPVSKAEKDMIDNAIHIGIAYNLN